MHDTAGSLTDPLAARLVRYSALKPCTTAFIDARTPGSDRKENFTIIGPGVAESPDQHVHIAEPHGFNIGGARQPPHCTNSQHFHETAEVFFVHSGVWAFRTGERADEGEIILHPGDAISIPVRIFRGFENVGPDVGFLYAVLGGDDPGRVVWAPDVLERAQAHGLILLDTGRLIDTRRGETIPPGGKPMIPLSRAEIEAHVRHCDSEGLRAIVVRGEEMASFASSIAAPGVHERLVLGPADPAEGAPAGKMNWPHGFVCRRLDLEPGAESPRHVRDGTEVAFVHTGQVRVDVDGAHVVLGPGDTFSIPVGAARRFAQIGAEPAQLFLTRSGDAPGPARLV